MKGIVYIMTTTVSGLIKIGEYGDEIYKLSPLTRDTFSKKVSAMLVAHIKVLPIGHLMARN